MTNRKQARSVLIGGAAWYVASDVAKLAGYRDAVALLVSALPGQTRKYPIATSSGEQSMWVISKPGLEYVLSRLRRREARDIATDLGLDVVWSSPIEVETLAFIEAAFAHLPLVRQHRVGRYRIDLYMPSLNIAVECDEDSHATSKRSLADEKRQRFIEEQIGCRFVRYKPQSPGFNPGIVVNEILVLNDFGSLRKPLGGAA